MAKRVIREDTISHERWMVSYADFLTLLLAFFVVGVALGVLAMTTTVLRYRRELGRLRKDAEQKQQEAAAVTRQREQPPPPESIIEQVGL